MHVNAVMWRMVYRELRALTNDGMMNLNPMELNEVYEQLWNVGTLLRSEDTLTIFDDQYRPWPKIHDGTEASDEFYKVHDRNKQVHDYPSTNYPLFVSLTLCLAPTLGRFTKTTGI